MVLPSLVIEIPTEVSSFPADADFSGYFYIQSYGQSFKVIQSYTDSYPDQVYVLMRLTF